MTTLALAQCPACGGEDFQEFELGEGNVLRRCTQCDTISARSYVDPREVYVDGYMQGEAGPFGLDASHPIYQLYLARVAARRVRLIGKATAIRRGSLLDVGCGTGEVLVAARDQGWRAVGVEPERTSAEIARARGLEVRATLLEESGLPERSFDVVSAFHVLEHMRSSLDFLALLRRWVAPGGFVVVEVPNWATVQRRRLREHWSSLRPGEHLVHFTPATLRRTFCAAGIVPILTRSPVYLGPPQSVEHALNDLGRYGRFRRLMAPLTTVKTLNGARDRYPTAAGWAVLRAAEAVYDRAGVGTVVFCIGQVR